MDDDLRPSIGHDLTAYICVDVETAGPIPGDYALLSIGACTLTQPRKTFYIELKPDKPAFSEEALSVCNFSMEELTQKGTAPLQALQEFEKWIQSVTPTGKKPIFIAFNAPFDWMFINEYFFRYLDRNPFGHSALDIKAFYMGLAGVTWEETSMKEVIHHFSGQTLLTHHALQDALDQADLFEKMLRFSHQED